jgi:hypothetical protein
VCPNRRRAVIADVEYGHADGTVMTVEMRHAVHRCVKCSNRWGGLNTAHCGACHETFTTARIFDMHRRDGRCRSPESFGLVPAQRDYRCWTTPIDPNFVHPSKSQPLSRSPRGVRARKPRQWCSVIARPGQLSRDVIEDRGLADPGDKVVTAKCRKIHRNEVREIHPGHQKPRWG